MTNLPAFPDNISTGDDGLIWVTDGQCRASRPWMVCRQRCPRCARRYGPSEALHPEARVHLGVAYDATGRSRFFGRHERFFMVTGVRDRRPVAMGNLNTTTIARGSTSPRMSDLPADLAPLAYVALP